MPCVCVRGRRNSAVCVVCHKPGADRLCDGRDLGAAKTCDAPIHARCAVQVKKPQQAELLPVPRLEVHGDDTLDYCPKHAPAKVTP